MSQLKLKTKVYVTLAIGLFFLSIASVGNAWGPQKGVSHRPLSEWTETNPRVVYGFTTNWDLLPDGYLLIPIIDNPDQYSGQIREKVLKDGRAEITVFVRVKSCPMSLYGLEDVFHGVFKDIMVDTTYQCIYVFQFIVPEPNKPIPNMWDVLDGVAGSEWVSTKSIGFGRGTFTDYAENFGFTSGETGKVFLHQESHIDSEGQEVWPYETINVF